LHSANGYAYTRNGQFAEDKGGNVVSSTGQTLQVYPPLVNGGFNTGTLAPLNLQTGAERALGEQLRECDLNLPANSPQPTVTPFDPTDSQTYNQSTSTSGTTRWAINTRRPFISPRPRLPIMDST